MAPWKGRTIISRTRWSSSKCSSKSGNSPTAEWRRPLQRLYPLEVKLDTEAVNPVPQAENVPVRLVRDEDVPVVVVNSD